MSPNEFIFEYLKADQDTGAGSYEKMVAFTKDFEWFEVKSHILKLKYFFFLKTSYWRIISDEVKRRGGWKCSCGCRENLQVHHTEEGDKHHGEEHLFLEGLVCLCKKCHEDLHGVQIKVAEKKRQRNNKKQEILARLPHYPQKISEEELGGSSFTLTRKLLEELEHERKVVIERNVYDGWRIYIP